MNKKALSCGAGVLAVICCWYLYQPESGNSNKLQTEAQNHSQRSQLRDTSVAVAAEAEAALLRETSDLLSRVNDLRRHLKAKETPEDRERRANYKLRRYHELFRSWNISDQALSESIELLVERDKALEAIDGKMLDNELAPHVAAKEKKRCKEEAELKLSGIIGPELSVQFSILDDPSNRRKNSSNRGAGSVLKD